MKCMYTYDYTHYFSYTSWFDRELLSYDNNLGPNAKEDLIESLAKKFDDELNSGILHKIVC